MEYIWKAMLVWLGWTAAPFILIAAILIVAFAVFLVAHGYEKVKKSFRRRS